MTTKPAPDAIDEDTFWRGIWRCILTVLDLVERRWCITPRNKEIRDWYKEQSRKGGEE